MSPYDPCVVNKVMNGTQLTVAWHVNDLKVSRKQLSVLEAFTKQLNDAFGKEAPICLFGVNSDNPKVLEKDRKDAFVHVIMQLLYLSQHKRPDIRTAVSFLCGRLQQPDEDEYKKVGTCDRILTRNNLHAAEAEGQQHMRNQMVGGRIMCRAPRHEGSHRCNVVTEKRNDLQHVL